jgi:pilus assembly protein FimV
MVANAHKVLGASVDQMLVAFYRANEGAFLDANMNRLPAGRVLAVPDGAAVLAVGPDEARRTVAAHRDAVQPAQAAPERAAPADRLKLSRADGATRAGGADDVAAVNLALKEAHERIAALEKNIEGLQKLGELQNRQIARLQQAALAGAAPHLPGDAAAGPGLRPRVAALPAAGARPFRERALVVVRRSARPRVHRLGVDAAQDHAALAQKRRHRSGRSAAWHRRGSGAA